MKIRSGFVSNSSSASFVIGKYFMTPEQISEMSDLVEVLNEVKHTCEDIDGEEGVMYNGQFIPNGDTYINESEYYFFGTIDYEHGEILDGFIWSNGLEKYIEVEE